MTKKNAIQRPWTEKEDEIFKTMWLQGRHAAMIEVALNRSLEAIRTRAKKLGIKRDPKTKYLSTTRFKDLAIGIKREPPKRKAHKPSSGQGVLLVEIDKHQCHFPIEGQLYCGAECDRAYGYCKTHHIEMWNK